MVAVVGGVAGLGIVYRALADVSVRSFGSLGVGRHEQIGQLRVVHVE